jgi:hypothetical protein
MYTHRMQMDGIRWGQILSPATQHSNDSGQNVPKRMAHGALTEYYSSYAGSDLLAVYTFGFRKKKNNDNEITT